MIDRKKARRAYNAQKGGAKHRGIVWLFEFEEWLRWWGEDFEKRGVGHDQLQMQRFHDKGPYAFWNVRKGAPKTNAKTSGSVRRAKNTSRILQEREFLRSALPSGTTRENSWEDEGLTEDEAELRHMFRVRTTTW